MNLLNDISSEMAVAILVNKEFSEKVNSTDGIKLIDKVCDILETISEEETISNKVKLTKKANSTSH